MHVQALESNDLSKFMQLVGQIVADMEADGATEAVLALLGDHSSSNNDNFRWACCTLLMSLASTPHGSRHAMSRGCCESLVAVLRRPSKHAKLHQVAYMALTSMDGHV